MTPTCVRLRPITDALHADLIRYFDVRQIIEFCATVGWSIQVTGSTPPS